MLNLKSIGVPMATIWQKGWLVDNGMLNLRSLGVPMAAI